MIPLSSSPVGKEQTVQWIIGNSPEIASIRNLGFTEGSSVMVVSRCFGSVIVALNHLRFIIDNDVAFHIKVN